MLKYSFVCCLLLFLVTGLFTGCHEKKPVLFHRLSNSESGIDFRNLIEENEEMNVLNYTYFYNGGGVAAGDINGDGLPDLLFTGNMVKNRLYLNKGNHRFEDITEKSGIAKAEGWCTGATMVDINGDGKLDIYICRSADVDPEKRANLLYINNGDNTFTEKAHEYGLDDKGYSTQASFFDYDKDGDLDVIIINHSLQQYTSGTLDHPQLRQQYNEFFATKLYRNDGGHFTDVSREAGILSNVLSFGLGVSISDFNNDGELDALAVTRQTPAEFAQEPLHHRIFLSKNWLDSPEFARPDNWNTLGAVIADLDRDGRLDLAFGQAYLDAGRSDGCNGYSSGMTLFYWSDTEIPSL